MNVFSRCRKVEISLDGDDCYAFMKSLALYNVAHINLLSCVFRYFIDVSEALLSKNYDNLKKPIKVPCTGCRLKPQLTVWGFRHIIAAVANADFIYLFFYY